MKGELIGPRQELQKLCRRGGCPADDLAEAEGWMGGRRRVAGRQQAKGDGWKQIQLTGSLESSGSEVMTGAGS